MKQTINVWDFRDAFQKMGRGDQFSYAGLGALFDYLEEGGEDVELDVIALCCEFSEYPSAVECVRGMGDEIDFPDEDYADEEEKEEAALDYLNGETAVIEFDGGIIIQDF